MTETILFVGGPMDGKVVGWSGGDVIRVPHLPSAQAMDILPAIVPPTVEFIELIYRRSADDPRTFVLDERASGRSV